MKILIYGTGGIGGFIGTFLLKTNHEIFFLSRGKTLKKFEKNGIELISPIENLRFEKINILSSLKNNFDFDIIILAVKLYDFDKALLDIKSNFKKIPLILPFQNGIYAEEKLKENIGKENVCGAVAQISSYLDKKARIVHNGKLATFFVGDLVSKTNYTLLKLFSNDCQKVGLDLRYSEKINEKLWDKFIFLTAYSGVTTLTGLTLGEIFKNKKLKIFFTDAMNETFLLSRKFDIFFSKNPVDLWLQRIKKLPFNMTSSMYLDFEKKKKIELSWLSGFVVKSCKLNRIDCSTHEKIVNGINTI